MLNGEELGGEWVYTGWYSFAVPSLSTFNEDALFCGFQRLKLRAKKFNRHKMVGGRTLLTGFISSHESGICLGGFSLDYPEQKEGSFLLPYK